MVLCHKLKRPAYCISILYCRAFQPAGHIIMSHVAREAILCGPQNQMLSYIFAEVIKIVNMKFLFYSSTAVVDLMKFNSRKLTQRPNFASCGPPYDPADSCAVHGGFTLESPAVSLNRTSTMLNLPHKLQNMTTLSQLISILNCQYVCCCFRLAWGAVVKNVPF